MCRVEAEAETGEKMARLWAKATRSGAARSHTFQRGRQMPARREPASRRRPCPATGAPATPWPADGAARGSSAGRGAPEPVGGEGEAPCPRGLLSAPPMASTSAPGGPAGASAAPGAATGALAATAASPSSTMRKDEFQYAQESACDDFFFEIRPSRSPLHHTSQVIPVGAPALSSPHAMHKYTRHIHRHL